MLHRIKVNLNVKCVPAGNCTPHTFCEWWWGWLQRRWLSPGLISTTGRNPRLTKTNTDAHNASPLTRRHSLLKKKKKNDHFVQWCLYFLNCGLITSSCFSMKISKCKGFEKSLFILHGKIMHQQKRNMKNMYFCAYVLQSCHLFDQLIVIQMENLDITFEFISKHCGGWPCCP